MRVTVDIVSGLNCDDLVDEEADDAPLNSSLEDATSSSFVDKAISPSKSLTKSAAVVSSHVPTVESTLTSPVKTQLLTPVATGRARNWFGNIPPPEATSSVVKSPPAVVTTPAGDAMTTRTPYQVFDATAKPLAPYRSKKRPSPHSHLNSPYPKKPTPYQGSLAAEREKRKARAALDARIEESKAIMDRAKLDQEDQEDQDDISWDGGSDDDGKTMPRLQFTV